MTAISQFIVVFCLLKMASGQNLESSAFWLLYGSMLMDLLFDAKTVEQFIKIK